jgi:hypothetical protein
MRGVVLEPEIHSQESILIYTDGEAAEISNVGGKVVQLGVDVVGGCTSDQSGGA